MKNITVLLVFGVICGAVGLTVGIIGKVFGQSSLVNTTELDTLDRMRYTAIQMTILDLQNTNEFSNLTNDEIASMIFEYQQTNDSIDRLTTVEIENLYRNITAANSTL